MGDVGNHVGPDPLPAGDLGADPGLQALFPEVGAPRPAHDHDVDGGSDRRDTELAVPEERARPPGARGRPWGTPSPGIPSAPAPRSPATESPSPMLRSFPDFPSRWRWSPSRK